MGTLGEALGLLFDPSNWTGELRDSGAILDRLWQHIYLSGTAVVTALVMALPVGMYIGHRRRFEFLTVSISNIGRALPSFAVLALTFTWALRVGISFEFWPAFVAMVMLAIPPIVTNTYVGLKEVDADVVEAARGMGLSGREILWGVEFPLAVPLIVAGIKTSLVQVIATATLAALVAGPGLGRYIVNGFARQDHALIMAGAILVALLAIVAELGMAGVERWVRPGRSRSRPDETPFDAVGVQPSGAPIV
ncbi:MAG: ABC transporter permease [Actinomycetota bacterium]